MAAVDFVIEKGEKGNLKVHKTLKKCVEEIIRDTGVSSAHFWNVLSSLVHSFRERNLTLLKQRDSRQAQIDEFCRKNKDKEWDTKSYRAFLTKIGYLVGEPQPFKIQTQNVDVEIANTPGPQLVVPIDNARYALNAVNARWGSLLDAFYGTDAGPPEVDGAKKTGRYNPVRGARVFDQVHQFLDEQFPFEGLKWGEIVSFSVDSSKLFASDEGGKKATLRPQIEFSGFNGTRVSPQSLLLCHHGLHVEVKIDRNHDVGKTHKAGIREVLLESAISAIADCEDSVAAVDAEDKARVYSNWAGIMRGDLKSTFSKGRTRVTRCLNPDRTFLRPDGQNSFTIPSRATMLVRNVGIHTFTDAVLTAEGFQIPEGILDALVTTLAAMHDIGPVTKKNPLLRNSRTGSMYLVKPKMQGPEEVQFTVDLLEKVEEGLGLPKYSVKLGIMDEERRTTLNLPECLHISQEKYGDLLFQQKEFDLIHTFLGFLDRTGDEIHTSFHAGPVMLKNEIKNAPWYSAYETWNVDSGVLCGLVGKGQIGKGMWAAPDAMAEMLEKKHNHPRSGATTGWVPSPTAATLHAIHYHWVDVRERQKQIASEVLPRASIDDLLTPPLLRLSKTGELSKETIKREVENNAQGILGYVVRWVVLGVGCSKVLDVHDVGLMEDRATLRISSQHIANWIHHRLVSVEDVKSTFRKMGEIVDRQNDGVVGYEPMGPKFEDSLGFQCALELVMNGASTPNGLTEATLAKYRLLEKERKISRRSTSASL